MLANEDLDLEIRTLSVLHGISTAEAKKSLFFEANSDAALDAIEKEFKGRISGIYVENAPTYKIVVRVKGSGTNQKRNVAVGNAVSKQNLPIEIQYGATETKEAGRAQINNVSKLVKTYFNTVQSYAYDERTGAIVVSVKGKETAENLKKVDTIKMAWNNLNLPLEFKFVNWTIKPLVDAHGGSFVVDKSQAPTYFDCTTAFGIKDSTGKKYMSTAAHCPNNFEDKQNGTKYTFVGEIPFNQENDFQWNSTTATITNKFYVGPSTTRTLTG
ncbi:S1 family peptidase [Acinetobacter proteolyticus]|uniref:S1 family peptidase n=1 Tax=Acinetobacter proteolyticus TaxID=1776741 RepID=UPI001E4A0786|nr:S1 family peptidase [Acinetobacter proteolyticus]